MNSDYSKMWFRPWGSSAAMQEFPYTISNVSTLPEHDVAANDVDNDAYTNTAGYTVRNRVRHDVATLTFNIPEMSGAELHRLFDMTTNVWLECRFFYEPSWGFVNKKMYRNGTVSYHKYYVDPINPDKNIYTDIQFGFVEE